jgi:preprotein translocase subunit SecF
MEIIIALIAVVLVGAIVYFNRSSKGLDVNNDGKVDLADAKAAVDNTVAGVTAAADVNNDGKVDAKDAEVVVEKAKTEVKKAATTVKAAVKKAAPKKAPAKRGPKPKQK